MDSVRTIIKLLGDLTAFICLIVRQQGARAAEDLFLRKQLARHQERELKPTSLRHLSELCSICFPGCSIGEIRWLLFNAALQSDGIVREAHLRIVTKDWVTHYNRGRPHASFEPIAPDPPINLPDTTYKHRHRIPGHLNVVVHPILSGLHHEYGLVAISACFSAVHNSQFD